MIICISSLCEKIIWWKIPVIGPPQFPDLTSDFSLYGIEALYIISYNPLQYIHSNRSLQSLSFLFLILPILRFCNLRNYSALKHLSLLICMVLYCIIIFSNSWVYKIYLKLIWYVHLNLLSRKKIIFLTTRIKVSSN